MSPATFIFVTVMYFGTAGCAIADAGMAWSCAGDHDFVDALWFGALTVLMLELASFWRREMFPTPERERTAA